MEENGRKTFPVAFEFDGIHYEGEAVAVDDDCGEVIPQKFSILLNTNIYFQIECTQEGWKVTDDSIIPQYLAAPVGNFIFDHYGWAHSPILLNSMIQTNGFAFQLPPPQPV